MLTNAMDAFRAEIEAAGLRPDPLLADGILHRCPVEGKPHAQDGAYVLHLDFPASGWWLNYRTGEAGKWKAKLGRKPSKAEQQALKNRIETDSRTRLEEKAKRQTEAAEAARKILAEAPECTEHAYLSGKGLKPCPGLKLAHDGRLMVPVYGSDGKLVSLQYIANDGEKRFLTGGRKKGGFFVIKGKFSPLFICEGVATGLSIGESTKGTVLCAFDAGNLEPVAAFVRQKFPSREIVICADDDHANPENPGVNKATAAALAVDALIAVPHFQEPFDGTGKPRTDFNDLHQTEGVDQVREQLARAVKPEPLPTQASGKSVSDNPGGPFLIKADGVYYLEEGKDGEVYPVWVCSMLRVLARTRNTDSAEWGYLLEVIDPEGRAHRWAMPASLKAGNGDGYRAELLSMGLDIAPGLKSKQRLDRYLGMAKVEVFARCVDRLGWHGGAYVLPDAVYGNDTGEPVVPQGLPIENPFRQKGTLEEWQEHVGRACAGNSRLVLAVCVALAAPLLEPLGQESGGLHLVGGSSLGKTTALRVAGSVCGGGLNGFIKQWRATDNGLESIAAAHCDALLCLDEMGQAGGKVVSEVAYMLANGQGKSRAARDGQARKTHTWRVLFLSTGEITLADKLAEDGKGRVKAGQAVRVVDIPADAGAGLGLFEMLHSCASADLLARQLKEASNNYYGTPFRAFLQALVADRDALIHQVQDFMRTFEAENCPEGADGQVKRVCGRFALLAAAGELGASLGVLPWTTGEAARAAATCLRSWVGQRGGTGAAEVTAGLEQVRRFFQAHGAARFEDLDATEPRAVVNRAGYRRRENGEIVFMVFPEIFKGDVCAGFNAKVVCAELKSLGILRADSGHNTKNIRTPDGQRRMYVLTSAILGGPTDSSGNSPENAVENVGPMAEGLAVPSVAEPVAAGERDRCCRSHESERSQANINNYSQVAAATAVSAQSDSDAATRLGAVHGMGALADMVTI